MNSQTDEAAAARSSNESSEWHGPWPCGLPTAVDAAGGVAVPLLAGFTFALIGIVVSTPQQLRWPGAALSLLAAAAVFFIAAVQYAFWTRQYSVAPSVIQEWADDHDAERLLRYRRVHQQGFDDWSRRFRISYRVGLLLLLGGVTLTLVPPDPADRWRWVAIAISAAGLAGELLWILAGIFLSGSHHELYYGQKDEPSDVSLLWLRRRKALRWLARQFVPVVWVERENPGRQGEGATGDSTAAAAHAEQSG